MPAVTHNSLAAYGNHGICAGAALAQQGAAAFKLPGPQTCCRTSRLHALDKRMPAVSQYHGQLWGTDLLRQLEAWHHLWASSVHFTSRRTCSSPSARSQSQPSANPRHAGWILAPMSTPVVAALQDIVLRNSSVSQGQLVHDALHQPHSSARCQVHLQPWQTGHISECGRWWR